MSSVGRDATEMFANLCAGRTGLGPLRGFDSSRFRARYAYEIDDRPERGRDIPRRATQWLIEAIRQAVTSAGLDEDLTDVPVLVGTGLRELRSLELRWRDQVEFSVDELHFGSALRERFRATQSYTFSNACAASLNALALGADLLALGTTDTVVVAGVDVLTESMHGLLERVHPTPPDCVRPFDRDRKGVLMGEGAAAVVLCRPDVPGRAAPLGWVRGVSVNCDAFHETAPSVDGIAQAMRAAHTQADIGPERIDLVMVHGTGTLLNDEAEAVALGRVFGPHIELPLLTAIKSMTGHTSGASGLLGAIVAMKAMRLGLVPPTLGLTEPVEEAARLRFVRGKAARADTSVAQVNAFGFGGTNAVAILTAAR